ncbi:hypothetical protein RUM43_003554 [Polyplax serrata]|uniref:Uncharacterized protein n=1 Tax=Polyplax serrata TaxID=468196 RepID=A0AAN8S9E9_POLSC
MKVWQELNERTGRLTQKITCDLDPKEQKVLLIGIMGRFKMEVDPNGPKLAPGGQDDFKPKIWRWRQLTGQHLSAFYLVEP